MRQNLTVGLICLILVTVSACSPPKPTASDYTETDITYPLQTEITNAKAITINKGRKTVLIYPRTKYAIGALVAKKSRYRFDQMAFISPMDLALVWGPLTLAENYKQLTIRQSKRRYRFFLKRNAKISVEWVYANSSNNHLIPANNNLKKALSKIKKNDLIYIEGYLVNVVLIHNNRTINWNTSLTRNDKGDGACEIIYVTKLKRNYHIYD